MVLVLLMRREAEVATRKDRRLLLLVVAERDKADCDDSGEASRPTRDDSRGTSAEPGTKADEPPLEQRQRIKGRVDVARMVALDFDILTG